MPPVACNVRYRTPVGRGGGLFKSHRARPEELAAFHVEAVRDEDREPVMLAVRLPDLDASNVIPVYPNIAEPITTVIGMSGKEVGDTWEACVGTWQDSLDIVGGVLYELGIPAAALHVVSDQAKQALSAYLGQTSSST